MNRSDMLKLAEAVENYRAAAAEQVRLMARESRIKAALRVAEQKTNDAAKATAKAADVMAIQIAVQRPSDPRCER